MDTPQELLDKTFMDFIERAASIDPASEVATLAFKNIDLYSKIQYRACPPEPAPEPVPKTAWGKFKAGASRIWDNETTRVALKAGGAFAGVALVAYSTIRKDHVLERQALAQANQNHS